MIHRFTIDSSETDMRLDVFLCARIDGVTRSAVAKLLKAGAGTVNGKLAAVHRFLKPGDVVAFDDSPSLRRTRAEPTRTQKDASAATHMPKLDIVDETDTFLIIDKPVGVLVHPDTATKTGTLVDALAAHAPKIAKVGDDPERPGIMHRLDREVSGLMVVAKTQDAFDSLKRQFAEHSVDKRYLALVHGEITKDEGDIKFRIARSKTKARMAARPESEEDGKAAWTHFKVLRRFLNATLLELTILSGRTHQIRAHMLALGHPVMGDELYVGRATPKMHSYTTKDPSMSRKADAARRTSVPRLMLQAVHLSFIDPSTGERKTYDLPADPAFDHVMKDLS